MLLSATRKSNGRIETNELSQMPRTKYEKLDPEMEELRKAIGPIAANYSNACLGALDSEIDFAADFLLDL
jgi:hypothetical protein